MDRFRQLRDDKSAALTKKHNNISLQKQAALHRARCFIPVLALAMTIAVGGADFSQQAALFSSIIFCVALFVGVTDQNYTIPKLYFAMMGISIAVLLSGKLGDWNIARTELVTLWAGIALWLTGYIIGQNREAAYRTWSYLTWVGVFIGILAFIIHLMSNQNSDATVNSFQVGRLAGNFGSSNTAATLFGMFLIISLGRLTSNAHRKLKNPTPKIYRLNHIIREEFISIACALLSLACLLLTESRAGIIISVTVAIIFLSTELYRYRRRKRLLRGQSGTWRSRAGVVSVLIIVAGAISLLAFVFLQERSVTLIADSGGRLALFAEYWPKVLEKPWFGHGLGSFNRLNDTMVTADNVAMIGPLGAAHNVVLQWLLQLGVVGLALMSAVFLFILKDIFGAVFSTRLRDSSLFLAILCMTAIVVQHAMVDYALEIPAIMWTFAFILGLGGGRAFQINSQRAATS